MIQKLSATKLGKFSWNRDEQVIQPKTSATQGRKSSSYKEKRAYLDTFSNWFPSGTIGETLVTVRGAPKIGVLTF